MSEIYGVIGKSTYSNLLADPQGADVISVSCHPGKGLIKTGLLLVRDSATGMYKPAETADIAATNQIVVLAEDVDTGSDLKSGTTYTAEDAAAYRAGAFIDGKVTLSDGSVPTAEQKIILRQFNIVFDKEVSTETVTNTVTA